MNRVAGFLVILQIFGGIMDAYPIKRVLGPKSTPEERIKVAKQYKDVKLNLPKKLYAVIKTNKGVIKAVLYPQEAPKTVENFVKLSLLGFYDGLIFHRYVKNFVIQGGDPYGTGYGDAGYTIPLEVSKKVTHVKGALGIARGQDPNSGSCQFYITLAPAHFLDGKYTVFGRVTKGMDVVLSLRKGDKIEHIDILGIEKNEKVNKASK